MPSDLTFRLTQPEDAPRLTQWLMDPDILRWFPMENLREVEDAVRVWVGYSRMSSGLTAEWKGEPCAMANLYIQPYAKLKHTCLFSVIVQASMRGKGIGGALISELMKHAKERFGIEILHLEVYENNPAKRLYERLGFKEFGCQTHFIKEADGCYRGKTYMQKRL